MTPRDGAGPAVEASRAKSAEGAAGPAEGAAGPRGPSRRRMLAGTAVFGAGAVAGGLTGYLARSSGEQPAAVTAQTVPFYGVHQAGIVTPAQARLAFGTLTVASGTTAADLRDLLREWTSAAARMTAGPAGRRGHLSRRAAGGHRRGVGSTRRTPSAGPRYPELRCPAERS